ncbi:MAG TPA: DnaB-like helicase C-terminal domain-containing protein [Vicinamibacteria bacterium]|nr:DnaB-like helicase C-terminal domain-containing protein [Vicinamibacteria bacterium]
MSRSSMAEIVRALGAKASGDGYVARCPAHEDRNPSLSIAEKNGTLLFRCFVGCSFEAIAAALEARGLHVRQEREERAERVWTIRDASGRALAQHVRVDGPGGKTVFWRGPVGEKAKLAELGLRLVDLPLYGTELLAKHAGEPVVVCEGEKAADAARTLGLLALGTSTGASSCPSPAALAPLKGRAVTLWPDADDEGRAHMARLARALAPIVASVRMIRWPAASPKGDAADFVAAGLKRDAFDALPEAAPVPATDLVYLHVAADDALAELGRFAEGDLSRYVSTGIPGLDRALGGGLRRGEVTLLGAPTGAGKTTILGAFAMAAAGAGGALFASPEMSTAQLAEREIVRRAGYSRWALAPWRQAVERTNAKQALQRAAAALMNERPKVLLLDRAGASMDDVERAAEDARAMFGGTLAAVFVDYAQEIADPASRDPRYRAVGAVGRRAVELARRLDVAVLVASQLNTFKDGNKTGYTFRETSDLERTAANVLLFVVEWETDAATGRRQVAGASFRATKVRSGALFELPVTYRPALFRVEDTTAAIERATA